MQSRVATIAEAMTSKVLTVHPKTTMDKVAEIFEENDFHHLPIVEDGKIVGMISSTDLNKLEDHFTLFKKKQTESINEKIMRSLLACEVMTKQVATLHPDDTLECAVGIFRENLFHALPVVDQDKNLVGILTPYDIMVWAFRPEPAGVW